MHGGGGGACHLTHAAGQLRSCPEPGPAILLTTAVCRVTCSAWDGSSGRIAGPGYARLF